jgi:hypothetical protein
MAINKDKLLGGAALLIGGVLALSLFGSRKAGEPFGGVAQSIQNATAGDGNVTVPNINDALSGVDVLGSVDTALGSFDEDVGGQVGSIIGTVSPATESTLDDLTGAVGSNQGMLLSFSDRAAVGGAAVEAAGDLQDAATSGGDGAGTKSGESLDPSGTPWEGLGTDPEPDPVSRPDPAESLSDRAQDSNLSQSDREAFQGLLE